MNRLLFAAALVASAATAAAQNVVYTMTNQADDNSIVLFVRNANTGFQQFGQISTGGLGLDGNLGSQNPFIFTTDENYMLVTNPGSNDVTVMQLFFGVIPNPIQTIPSGGERPLSLAMNGNTVYVLNQGAPAGVTGFTFSGGQLTPIPGASYALSDPDANPGQVQFGPLGETLLVTERGTDRIAVFPVQAGGTLGTPNFVDSPGSTPFGFDFTGTTMVLSEASPVPANTSSVSSFLLNPAAAALQTVSSALPTSQDQACWIEITANGRYAYSSNTPSESISGYRVMDDGALVPLTANSVVASTAGLGGARDIYIENGVLFGVLSGAGSMVALRVLPGGELSQPVSFGSFAPGAAGVLAR